jgi:hypothetical protein
MENESLPSSRDGDIRKPVCDEAYLRKLKKQHTLGPDTTPEQDDEDEDWLCKEGGDVPVQTEKGIQWVLQRRASIIESARREPCRRDRRLNRN